MAKYKVLQIMLNKGRGGMEESFRHYNLALKTFCQVTSLVHPIYLHHKSPVEGVEFISDNTKFGLLSSIINCRKLVRQIQPDLIIAHGSPALFLGKISSLGCNIKLIGVRHTFFRSKFAALKWSWQADHTITVNQQLAKIVNKSFLVYNIVHLPILEGAFCSINPNRPIKIGFLGRLVWKKGVQFLIRAIGLLNVKSLQTYELIIGGEGRYMKALKNLVFLHGIQDKVTFINYIENKKEFFQNIDIFCLPSIEEAFGLVLIESMAHGVPVIASDIPGIQEVVENTRNGLLFKLCDYHDLANKISYLANNNDHRLSLIDEGLQDIKNKYNITQLSSRLEEVIAQIKADEFRKV
jgi:glycosyltransferase involved in cell wall biosynthesis